MPCKDYRPAIGETIFVSLSDNLPMLITITGFRYHTYLKKEVMEYQCRDGSSTWSTYDNQTFFPEISPDTPYIYVIAENEDAEDSWGTYREEAFFFTPEDAFDHLEALEAGTISSRNTPPVDPEACVVEIRKVT